MTQDSRQDDSVWDDSRRVLGTSPAGGFNMAWAALGRRAAAGQGSWPALRCIRPDGSAAAWTVDELWSMTGRTATVLRRLGMEPGDTVFTLLPRRVELFATILGTLLGGGVAAPLFPTFGPEPLRLRLELGNARLLVTTASLWQRKAAAAVAAMADPPAVVLLSDDGGPLPAEVHDFAELVKAAAPQTEPAPTGSGDTALLHVTSGTTGRPKGALHAHGALVAQHATARGILGLGEGDVYWCTADPGWVTGTVYGVLAPLACGAEVVVDEGDFDPARWVRLAADQRVAVWYTTPTALRLMMRCGDTLARGLDLSGLRHLATVGEPLNGEAVAWSARVLGTPARDTWWQTETGAIMIATPADEAPVPGAIGRPVPGVEAALMQRTGLGVEPVAGDGAVGEIALRTPWPSLFLGYLGEEGRTRACFAGGWYLSGDLARRDADGRFHFVGRSDDVIKTSGHLVGPFEVEQVLLQHPAVLEAGVIGVPCPIAGESVKGFVTLRPGILPSDGLAADILAHARRALGPALAPRAIAFTTALPHTGSGKIVRRLLKAHDLGLPEGDVSSVTDATPPMVTEKRQNSRAPLGTP